MTGRFRCILATLILACAAFGAAADPARDAILAALTEEARKSSPGFTGFSAQRGEAFWFATHSGGRPDTPSCTSCHARDPTVPGETRAGKAIEPMAVSRSSKRFTDAAEVAKWFTRNCNGVLGRECTPVEKGDVLTFLSKK